MGKPSVLVLYNQPLLPKDHPEAESEHTIVAIAEEVARNLRSETMHVSLLALGPDPVHLWKELHKRKPDVVFNLFEGSLDNPESESYVAGLLDWGGVPYTGSPFQALVLARAKHSVKTLLKGAGLPTADFQVVSELPAPPCTLEFPVIVKPATQDASVGLDQESVCTNQRQVDRRVRYIYETYGAPVLVEEYIAGREFNVALIELPTLEYLPPAEITFLEDGKWPILTFAGKWNPVSTPVNSPPTGCPTEIPSATARKLGRLAMKAYRLLGCRDYARVDFRVRPNGKPFILEMNPNPEISDEAGFARSLRSAQITQRDFLIRLVEQALSRRHAPKPTFAPSNT